MTEYIYLAEGEGEVIAKISLTKEIENKVGIARDIKWNYFPHSTVYVRVFYQDAS